MNKRLLLLLGGMLLPAWMCCAMKEVSRYKSTDNAKYKKQLSNCRSMGVYNDILRVMKEAGDEKALLKSAPHTAVKIFLSSMNDFFKEECVPSLSEPVQTPYPDIKVMKQELADIKQRMPQPQSPEYCTNVARYISSCVLADKYFKMNDIPHEAWDAPNGNNMVMKLIELIAREVIFLKLKNGQPILIIHRPDRVKKDGTRQKLDPYEFEISDFSGLRKSIEQCGGIMFFFNAVSVFKYLEKGCIDGAQKILSLFTKQKINHSPKAVSRLRVDWDKYSELTWVNLSYLKLGSIPEGISEMISLTELELDHNQLTTIPTEVSALTNLRRINLCHNRLGSLPAGISGLASLTDLELWSNQLTTIPTEVNALTNLRKVNLCHNRLNFLPAGISGLVSLTNLDLDRNELISIPREISALTNLTKLNLSENELISIPAWISKLTNLTKLDLGNIENIKLPIGMIHMTWLQMNVKNKRL